MRGPTSAGRPVFVDTSAFAAVAIRRDAGHEVAAALFQEIRASKRAVFTTSLVLAETHALILSRSGRDLALDVLVRLDRSVAVVRPEPGDEFRARSILSDYFDKDFSLADAVSFAVMERFGIREAFTFDRHFTQYGLTVIGGAD